MNARFGWLLAVVLILAGCSDKVTQVIVTIDAEPGVRTDATRLHLVVLGGVGRTTAPTASRFDRDLTPGVGDPAYPFKLALAPLDGDVGRSYSVTATALAGSGTGTFIGQARLIGGYVEGETLNVRLLLEDACRTVTCGDDQTCKAGICVDARTGGAVDAGVPDAGQPEDGGFDAGFDAGERSDAGPDAGEPSDAGPDAADIGIDAGSDAGTPEVDAGTDGGTLPIDAGPPDFGVPDMGWRCAPRPTGDTRWPQYPLPDATGHARSYQVVTSATGETVIDCVTGLEWERATAPSTYTDVNGIMYCDTLVSAGYSDWRLPSRIELMTLVDYAGPVARGSPMIDGTAFPSTVANWYWSASGSAVSFDTGIAYRLGGTTPYPVRCVR